VGFFRVPLKWVSVIKGGSDVMTGFAVLLDSLCLSVFDGCRLFVCFSPTGGAVGWMVKRGFPGAGGSLSSPDRWSGRLVVTSLFALFSSPYPFHSTDLPYTFG